MKDKALVVLQALLEGHQVKVGTYSYETDEDGLICVVVQVYRDGLDGPFREELRRQDLDINGFIRSCRAMLDEAVEAIVADLAIDALKRSERKPR